jgi:hypothetical protein
MIKTYPRARIRNIAIFIKASGRFSLQKRVSDPDAVNVTAGLEVFAQQDAGSAPYGGLNNQRIPESKSEFFLNFDGLKNGLPIIDHHLILYVH